MFDYLKKKFNKLINVNYLYYLNLKFPSYANFINLKRSHINFFQNYIILYEPRKLLKTLKILKPL